MDKFWLRIIYIFSIVITLAITFLILGPRPEGMEGQLDVSALPRVNALLNTTTTLLLLLALWFIKHKEIQKHKITMLFAFGTVSLFLVTYVIYHWFKAGPSHIQVNMTWYIILFSLPILFQRYVLFLLRSLLSIEAGICRQKNIAKLPESPIPSGSMYPLQVW